ncbi:MAG: UMP kinase [Pelagibacterales bacterium]|nr:UMP kinase [Pelagibacterales bacterium]|tara:strand:+ start:4382 stop:5125 length:744 start_codon:yes stop_codon:yes gene_type:complete
METRTTSINIASKKRIMLKLSGEILVGKQSYGLDPEKLISISNDICNVYKNGKQICIVVGGGNIFRGISGASQGIDRVTADGMGMLATVINALALQNAIEKNNVPTRVLSAIPMQTICETFIKRRAIRHLEKGRIIIFAAGTGNPYFSTDTAATLRAAEMNCEVIFKGTSVDGVYDSDPKINSDSKMYTNISYKKVLSDNLKVMDSSAISMARDNLIPMVVFSILKSNSFLNASLGKSPFTLISEEK